jgi:Zn-dependent membrane protease YugP
MWASFRVKSAFNKYSKVRSMHGMTGAEAAEEMLRRAGISGVRILRSHGMLSDHYNPLNRTLNLSESVHDSNSIAAVGVATHEAGHAIQHARNYAPLWIRSALVPTANIGSSVGYIVMLVGLVFLQSQTMVLIGALLFSAVLLFQIVTLPVEFNASNRVKALVVEYGIVTAQEREGIDRVLNAAAMTYVAAAISTFAISALLGVLLLVVARNFPILRFQCYQSHANRSCDIRGWSLRRCYLAY